MSKKPRMKNLLIILTIVLYASEIFGQKLELTYNLKGSGNIEPILIESDPVNNSTFIIGTFTDTIIISEDIQYLSKGQKDIFVLKMNSNGFITNFTFIGGSGNDIPLESDFNNGIHLTGFFSDTCYFGSGSDKLISTGSLDGFYARISTDLQINLLRNIIKGESSSPHVPNSVFVDDNNNIINSGIYRNEVYFETDTILSNGFINSYIAKFSNSLVFNWALNIQSTNNATRVISSTNVHDGYFFLGYFRDTLFIGNDTLISQDEFSDIFLFKTDFDGNIQFVRELKGLGEQVSNYVTSDEGGNIYFVGYTSFPTYLIDSTSDNTIEGLSHEYKGSKDIVLIKYSSNGELLWQKLIGSIGDDVALKMYANDSLVALTGFHSEEMIFGNDTLSRNSYGKTNPFLIFYSRDGKQLHGLELSESGNNGNNKGQNIILSNNSALLIGSYQSDTLTVKEGSLINYSNNIQGFFLEYNYSLSNISYSYDSIYCFGDSTWISFEGKYHGVSFSIDGGNTFKNDSIFENVLTGQYDLIVKNRIISTRVDSLTITQPEVLEFVSIDSADASSQGAADGSIVAVVQGGTKPYSYSLNESTPQTDSAFTGLAQGKYKLVLQDANNCGPLETDSITIGPPPCEPINLISQNSADFACNLSGVEDSVLISIDAEGGLTGLIYSIDGGLSFEADGEFYVKQAGEYEVVVQDSTGCEILGDTLVVNQPDLFTITDIDSTDAGSRDASDGSIIVTVTGGTEPYEFSLNGGSPQANGGFTGLVPGKYMLSVQDANGCGPLETDSITIGPRPCEPISLLNLSYSDLDCNVNNGGEPAPISVAAEGGLTGLLYSIDGGDTFAPDGEFTVEEPGDYIVMAKDSTGCEEVFDTITISQPEEFDITSIYSSHVGYHGGNDGFILVNVVGGTLPYVFTLNGGSEQSTGSYMDIPAGKYQVEVVDANNCGPLETDSIIIEQPPVGLKNLGVKNVHIYPNPVNEELNIEFKLQNKEEERISIMDASGKVVVNKKFKAVNGNISERLDVSGLRNGVYFLRIGDGGEVLKIVKE